MTRRVLLLVLLLVVAAGAGAWRMGWLATAPAPPPILPKPDATAGIPGGVGDRAEVAGGSHQAGHPRDGGSRRWGGRRRRAARSPRRPSRSRSWSTCSPRAASSPSPGRRSSAWTRVALGRRAGPARIEPCSRRSWTRRRACWFARTGRCRGESRLLRRTPVRTSGRRLLLGAFALTDCAGIFDRHPACAHPHHGTPRPRAGAAGGQEPGRAGRYAEAILVTLRRPGARRAREGRPARGQRHDPRGASLAACPQASEHTRLANRAEREAPHAARVARGVPCPGVEPGRPGCRRLGGAAPSAHARGLGAHRTERLRSTRWRPPTASPTCRWRSTWRSRWRS